MSGRIHPGSHHVFRGTLARGNVFSGLAVPCTDFAKPITQVLAVRTRMTEIVALDHVVGMPLRSIIEFVVAYKERDTDFMKDKKTKEPIKEPKTPVEEVDEPTVV